MGEGVQPSGTVTFLFTDVEDHTRLWQEFPEDMPTCLERHDDIVRSAIEGNGGYVFATAGDAFCAAFPSVESASTAASEAQQGLRSTEWPDGCVLRVRMGLHTGEAQERDGDYFGPAVIRAARLMSLGHGGQVLVSAVSANLLAEKIEYAPRLVSLGEVELRGLGRSEAVSELRYPGLDEEFPPLAARRSRLGSLPSVPNELIGRDQEVVASIDLLRRSSVVTLVGPGGVGKTRLSVEVGLSLADRCSDGVWFVPLATVGDESSVPSAVAEVLGVQETAGRSLTESVIAAIAGRDLLLILDNCEHVAAGAQRFAEAIARECATVTVLATSRERLSTVGESVLPVDPLSLDVSETQTIPAVDLFVVRARSADPAFQPDPDGLAKISSVCRRLDGMPLAIELAAARVRGLGLDGIVDHLDDRFRLLRSRSGTDPRHHTLRATVGWSYDLLDDWLKVLFCRAGVFAGGFTREAAERVLAFDGLDALDVADGLAELTDKSMLQLVDGRTGRRYRMLETMRQFGADLLDPAEHHQNQVHFVAFYAEWCTATDRLLKGSEVAHAIRSMRDEFDNIREAFRLAMSQDRLELAADIVVALVEFSSRAVVGEPCVWAEELAERIHPEDHLYADVMASAVWGCRGRGDRQRAQELIAAYEQAEIEGRFDPSSSSDAYVGVTYWFWRRTDRSVALQERGIAKARADGDPWRQAVTLGTLAMAQDSFDRVAAERSARASIDLGRSIANEIATCTGLLAFGGLVAHSDAERAVELAEELVDTATSAGVLWHEATGTRLKAHALSRAGRLSEASESYAHAIEMNGVGDFGELLWYTVFNVVEHLSRIDDAEGAAVALGAFSSAPAAPSDDLIARAADRLRARLVDQLGSMDRELASEERGASMRLAELLHFLHGRLSEHAASVAAPRAE